MSSEPDPALLLYLASALKGGASLEEAVQLLGEKIPSHPWVTAALELSKETGGSLAPLLESAARSLRQKQEMRDKIRALSAQANASAWVVGLTPFGLFTAMLVVSPDYVAPLFQTTLGWMIAATALGLVAVGFWLVRRLNRLAD